MHSQNAQIQESFNIFDDNQSSLLSDFYTFLRFESISTQKEKKTELNNCAKWVKDYLLSAGMQVELWETATSPVVFAEWNKAGADKPTLLIYNHYDVQPADPFELWESPPFEPEERDGQIYARGAQDNKGQCFYTIAAVKTLLEKSRALPLNLKLIIEGEEEVGSAGLPTIFEKHKKDLQADHAIIVDVGVHSLDRPSITLGLRGICALEINLKGSLTDMHSGSHGGLAFNPNHALVQILGKMRADDGRILIPGFYDNVIELDPTILDSLDLAFDKESYFCTFGTKASGGEKDYTPIERAWLRPTLEINGLNGGYTGEGFKTVIPALAQAKLSCRLVPNQDPKNIMQLIKDFVDSNLPEGISCEINIEHGYGPAVQTSPDESLVQVAAKAISDVTGHQCSFIMEGASVPIASALSKVSGAKLLLMGYGLPSDNIHAPNEHFGIDRLKLGFATITRIIEKLSEEGL